MRPLSYFRRSVVAFPLAALAALAMFVISEVSYQDATSSLDSLGERAIARNRLNQVAKSLLDAETGQRGYLLSNRQEYLNPYRDAQEGLRESTEWLKKYYAGEPQQGQAHASAERGGRREDERALDLDRAARQGRAPGLARPAAERHRQGKDGAGAHPHRAAAGRGEHAGGQGQEGRLPDPDAQPHRHHRDGRGEPAGALHVPAADGDPRAPHRRGSEAHRERARSPRGRGHGADPAAEGAGAAPADHPRGRAQPAGARAPRRARRPAHRRQARRRTAQVAARQDQHARDPGTPRPPERDAERRDRPQAPDHRGPAALVAQQPRAWWPRWRS